MMPNLAAIEQHIRHLLKHKLPKGFEYHNLEHTVDVVRRALFYAQQEGLDQEQERLLQTAALFHDTGFTRAYEGHEEAGVQLARQTLPQFGYSQDDIDTVAGMIMATRRPQQPKNRLEEILCDADLDNLGRNDFYTKADCLRRELKAICGLEYSDEMWRRRLHDLLASHAYFTPWARRLRNEGKAKNLKGRAG